MKLLKQFIRGLTESNVKSAVLPWEVVEFLVKMYAVDGNPPLKHLSGSFSQAGSKRVGLPGGINIEWKHVGALYNDTNYTLVINKDIAADRSARVKAVLHEIQHYNQHVSWDSDDLSFRDQFVKGVKLPPTIDPDSDSGDPMGLYEISWRDITKFWVRKYGYSKAPHELDAVRFSEKNLAEALAFIDQHFG